MVACGMRHSLVLFAGNQVCGFDSGKRGQLGVSSDKTKSLNLPCVVSRLEDVEVVRIAANGDHSAAISGNGEWFSWGRGFCGSPDVQTPQCLSSSQSFREVALGCNHALLLTGFCLGRGILVALCLGFLPWERVSDGDKVEASGFF
ncbi:unnamed protein product [Eruca vesicaria subsp. sativa]|uniref:Uncharacterized protein n=1 Tax=Eruca vesicaria subsp. sativa TaxID=29727 RepID=A0ABC8K113_ERUVS|nr:unnamed protein product [Eruca vesicaria subsp. sativa]